MRDHSRPQPHQHRLNMRCCARTALLVLLTLTRVDGFQTADPSYRAQPLTLRFAINDAGGVDAGVVVEPTTAPHDAAAPAPTFGNAQEDEEMRRRYLRRIGVPDDVAAGLMRKDDVGSTDLQLLLSAHLLTVPFENLDQHSHPGDDVPGAASGARGIPRRPIEDLPSLDVRRSLRKICERNRGGFCYELNLSFAWLLRSLGFTVRLAAADVGCTQAIPAHVVLLVDGLLRGGEEETPVLVDVGFGTPGVCDVALPVAYDVPRLDSHGDSFRFERCSPEESERFDTVLHRRRLASGDGEEEPMYRFRVSDDLPEASEEFANGLAYVLNESKLFNDKRLCVVSTEGGHCTLGEGYIKWVERGETVMRVELPSETEWRGALSEHFAVVL